MITNPLIALDEIETSQLFALHMALAQETTGPEADAHIARATELANYLPGVPMERQVQLFETGT